LITEKHKRNYGVITLTTLAFIVDVVTGNVVRGVADTWEAAYWLANDFCMWRSVFELALVAVFIPVHTWFILKYRPRFDVWDLAMFSLWCLSMLMTVFDYSANDNLREVDMDIPAFALIAVVIWLLKLITTRKWNRK